MTRERVLWQAIRRALLAIVGAIDVYLKDEPPQPVDVAYRPVKDRRAL